MTRRNYETYLGLFSEFLGSEDITRATKSDMNRWVASLRERKLKDSSMSTNMSYVRAFFKWLVLNEHRADDPTGVFKSITLKPSQAAPKPLSADNRERLRKCLTWDTIPEMQKSIFVLVAETTGLRRHELCKMKWEDIDFEKKSIRGVGKGDKPFNLHLPPNTIERLDSYKEALRKNSLFGVYVLFSNDTPSHPLPYHLPWDWMCEIKERLGLPKETKLTPHCMRHDFTSTIMQSGKVPIDQAMKMTRHSKAETLMRYNEVLEAEISKKSDAIFG